MTQVRRDTCVLLLLLVGVVFSSTAQAQLGSLDPSFDGDGLLTIDIGGADTGFDIAIQPDGKLVTAGATFTTGFDLDFAVARNHPDGSPDLGFGTQGVVTTDFADLFPSPAKSVDQGEAVVLQADGKILVAGTSALADPNALHSDVVIARYHTDGSLDSSFGTGGRVVTHLGSTTEVAPGNGLGLAVQPDGKILFGGLSVDISNNSRRFLVIRYDTAGNLDSSFGVGGVATTQLPGALAPDLALQSDGRIVLAGGAFFGGDHDFTLVRYESNGTLDASFGVGGIVSTDFGGIEGAEGVSIQGDGKIVAVGDVFLGTPTQTDFALARYLPDGSLDAAFGSGGLVTTDLGGDEFGKALVIQANGRIVAVGDESFAADPDFLLARYLSDGSLDTSFGAGGLVSTEFGPGNVDEVRSVAEQSDGKIVAAGTTRVVGDPFPPISQDFALARYFGQRIPVGIDVLPGSDTNPINFKSQGTIPVAILGSDTLDVTDVDVSTLAFGSAAPVHTVGGHLEDVNDDGLTDLLSHYSAQETGIAFGQTEACVTGDLLDGTPLQGCDAIAVK